MDQIAIAFRIKPHFSGAGFKKCLARTYEDRQWNRRQRRDIATRGGAVRAAGTPVNQLLCRTEATQRHSRGDSLCGWGVGACARDLTTRSLARRAGVDDALVSGCGRDWFSVLDRICLVLRIHAGGFEARERDRPSPVDYLSH